MIFWVKTSFSNYPEEQPDLGVCSAALAGKLSRKI